MTSLRSIPTVPALAVVLLLAWAGLPGAVRAQAPRVAEVSRDHAGAVEAARLVADALLDDANLPGLSVAVGVDGELAWSEAFGYANLEQRVPVTPITRFRIGSVSKTLTATALGLLVERGVLDLDVPVQAYVPGFPEKRWPVTTRQLGGHLAGIRHYRGDEFLSDRHYETVPEGLEIFADDTLLFEPGTSYSYSSYGWNLLSAVLESAAGEPFLPLMDREVFDALGLRHTVAEQMDSIVPYRVSYYVHGEGQRLLNAPFVDNSYKWAGGGFLSTPEDLVIFGFAHLEPELLEEETVGLLMRSQRLRSGDDTGYGIGWSTGEDPHGRRTVGHGGGSVGGTTAFLTWPEEGMVVAVTVNLSSAPGVSSLAQAVAEIFRPATSAAPAASAVPGTAAAGADPLEGSFAFHVRAEGRAPALEGTVELTHDDGAYTGWIRAERLPWGRIVWGRAEPGGTHLVATTPRGLLNVWLDEGPDGSLTGRFMGPGPTRELTGRRTGG